MAVPVSLSAMTGDWAGDNSLWLSPDTPVKQCGIAASVETVAQGQAWQLRYSWFEDSEQDGILLLTQQSKTPAVTIFWLDSWHLANQWMMLTGQAREDGSVTATGTYQVPGHPDWGWRITIVPGPKTAWRLVMHNITPEGLELLAVEAVLVRNK